MADKFKPKVKTTLSNLRVIIDVEEPWLAELSPKTMSSRAERFIDEVKRHCDDWKYFGYEWDTEIQCVYCEYPIEPEGNPECCEKAVEDFDNWVKDTESK